MKAQKGLTSKQAEESRKKYGTNRLSQKERKTFFKKYLEKFDDPIIIILLVALGINIIFTFFGKVDWFECLGIFVSVMIATLVGAFSEYKNEEEFQKIQNEAAKIKCKVYRDGNLVSLLSDEIVTHDIVLLQAGDMIPADGVVISGKIKVDQSALNGENEEVEKTGSSLDGEILTQTDFWNKTALYRGSVVCFGQCSLVPEICLG